MGLLASIYRWNADCTNNGITSQARGHHDVLILNAEGPFTPRPETPCVVIETDQRSGYKRAYPADPTTGKKLPGWWMMGGNFIHTSDSRFPNPYPIPVHDRQE